MLGIGFFEIVIIALVSLIVLGPDQLPKAMRKLAGLYRQFTALRDEFRFQVLSADPLKESDLLSKAKDEQQKNLKDDTHG